jgi:hypothetical protein
MRIELTHGMRRVDWRRRRFDRLGMDGKRYGRLFRCSIMSIISYRERCLSVYIVSTRVSGQQAMDYTFPKVSSISLLVEVARHASPHTSDASHISYANRIPFSMEQSKICPISRPNAYHSPPT